MIYRIGKSGDADVLTIEADNDDEAYAKARELLGGRTIIVCRVGTLGSENGEDRLTLFELLEGAENNLLKQQGVERYAEAVRQAREEITRLKTKLDAKDTLIRDLVACPPSHAGPEDQDIRTAALNRAKKDGY